MEVLKSASETSVNSATGTLLFIWSKVSNVIAKRTDFTYKLEVSGKPKTSVHSVTLMRPETEASFYEMTHLFIMTIVALGLATATIVIRFIDDVVFGTTRLGEPFRVAHELLICYFREIDCDPARILGLDGYGLQAGCHADFVLLQARDPVEALRLRATRLKVFRRGRLIASTPAATSTLQLAGRPAHTSWMTP